MKIVTIVGARPQFIKAATLSRVLRNEAGAQEILLHTGQHYDDNMSDIFFRELDIPEPVYNLGIGSGSHAAQTGMMLQGIEEILLKERPDRVVVYGDTNSTLAGALAAVKIHLPVSHVEAGLRSFNRNMPEEINRIVADALSEQLFAPTLTAVDNLKTEGLSGKTLFTGDVMFDSVLYYRDRVLKNPDKYRVPDLPQRYFLATIHRAENTDAPGNLRNIFQALSELPVEIILPLHPRTRRILADNVRVPQNVRILDPLGYLPMIYLTLHAEKVLTDSGGLQKEAYFLGKPCITLRTETEWVETLHDGWNTVTGANPSRIVSAAFLPAPEAPRKEAFGNGKAAFSIARHLLSR